MGDKPEGQLWVVGTPIGNLGDVTPRIREVLQRATLVLAEDTRRTRALLQHLGVRATLRSLHAHTEAKRIDGYLGGLKSGDQVALVSDAGTPNISDPGYALVDAALAAGIPVAPIPGPSAVTAALSVAGIPCSEFRFVGFLPRSGKRRSEALRTICASPEASVFFEAPNRLNKTLGELAGELAEERRVAVCRELTKVHEEVVRGSAAELAEHFAAGTKGEITVVVEGSREAPADRGPGPWTLERVDARLDELVEQGLSTSAIAKQVAKESGHSRRALFDLLVRRKKS